MVVSEAPSFPLTLLLPPSSSPLPPPLSSMYLKYSYGVWVSAVSSPSGVWGAATAEMNFVHFSLKIRGDIKFLRIN